MNGRMKSWLVCLVYLAQAVSGQSTPVAKSCDAQPEVIVSDATHVKHKGIQLKWRIVNHRDRPIFVYSTFLFGPRAAAWRKRKDGVFEIHISLPEKLGWYVYSYPKAVFSRVDAHGELKGVFIDPNPTIDLQKDSRVLLDVAYGSDVQQVKRALQDEFRHGSGHPANPLVDWQCIASSTVVSIH